MVVKRKFSLIDYRSHALRRQSSLLQSERRHCVVGVVPDWAKYAVYLKMGKKYENKYIE